MDTQKEDFFRLGPFDIEQGLMLFDQWKADPDKSQPLDDWVWDNIGHIFKSLEQAKHLQRYDE